MTAGQPPVLSISTTRMRLLSLRASSYSLRHQLEASRRYETRNMTATHRLAASSS